MVGRKDTEIDHHADCEPLPESSILALEVDRELRNDVRSHGKRPREAYNDMLASVAKRFKSSEQQAGVVAELPAYNEVRGSLCRHRTVRCLPVPDPLCIPEELQRTLRRREVDDDDPAHGEQFLKYSGQGGQLLIFCASTELAAIRQSQYLVCDGTFEMAPNSAYQLYTVHGFVDGEGVPLLWAILPNKTTETYKEMFQALRTALMSTFGDTGDIQYVITDFERAAINAVKEVFPEITIKGCSFHFRQALMRRVQQEGLKSVYDSDSEYPAVRQWIRYIMALSLLPAFAVRSQKLLI